MTHTLILAGKRPRTGTILETVTRVLLDEGAALRVEWRDPIAALKEEEPRLLVHRGLDADILADIAATRSIPSINDPNACLQIADRVATMAGLRAAGLPVPAAETYSVWEDIRQRAKSGPIFVKAVSGMEGRGAGVCAFSGATPPIPPFPGPWHVEETHPSDGFDRKLYVAGTEVFGLLKAWPRRDDAPPIPFAPTGEMVKIAREVGRVVGLEIFGVDLVGKNNVFSIVDVNPFPGFRGVTGASQAIAGYIATRAAES